MRRLLFVLITLVLTSSASAIMARDYTRTFRAHQSEVLACRGQQHDGSFTIEGGISPQGHAYNQRVGTAQPEAFRSVGECVVRRMGSWSFEPSSSGNPQIAFTLVFHADQFTIRRN